MPGTGDEDRVEVAEAFACFGERTTLAILTSIRQVPMASAVYLQKMGTTDDDESRRDRDARGSKALPMKE